MTEENKNINNSTNNIDSKSSSDKRDQYKLVVSDNGLDFPENIDFRNTNSLDLQLVNILVEQLNGTIGLEKVWEPVTKYYLRKTTNYPEAYPL
jgi:two-component sensor histidine kinase